MYVEVPKKKVYQNSNSDKVRTNQKESNCLKLCEIQIPMIGIPSTTIGFAKKKKLNANILPNFQNLITIAEKLIEINSGMLHKDGKRQQNEIRRWMRTLSRSWKTDSFMDYIEIEYIIFKIRSVVLYGISISLFIFISLYVHNTKNIRISFLFRQWKIFLFSFSVVKANYSGKFQMKLRIPIMIFYMCA